LLETSQKHITYFNIVYIGHRRQCRNIQALNRLSMRSWHV